MPIASYLVIHMCLTYRNKLSLRNVFCGLCYNAANISYYTASNGRMTEELCSQPKRDVCLEGMTWSFLDNTSKNETSWVSQN
jgi:hypothetical protein